MAMLKIPVTSHDHIQGDFDAPVLLVEYGDYECPHCGHAYPIIKEVQHHFGARLGLVFRNFPLNEIHPNAERAAEVAEFAAARGRFWEMHDIIFENQTHLDQPSLLELAKSLNLPAPDLLSALNGKDYASRVKNDFLGGVRSGVNGTPTLFINGRRHDGSYDYESLVLAIEEALSGAKSASQA